MTVIEQMSRMTVKEIAKEMGFNLPCIDESDIDMIAEEICWDSDTDACEICPKAMTCPNDNSGDYHDCENAVKDWLMTKFKDEQLNGIN